MAGNPLSDTTKTKNSFKPRGTIQSNSSLATAVPLTPAAGSNALILGVEDESIRLTMDGTTATGSVGILHAPGIYTYQFDSTVTFSVIENAASASIQYQWGRV